MRAGIQPGIAAPHAFDRQQPVMQVGFQKCGDLQLAPTRGLDACGAFGCAAVKEVKPGHREG